MYYVTCDGSPLLDWRDDDLILVNPKVNLEVNTVGEGSFTIYKNHPHFDKLKKLKSVVEVSDENGVIFRGRMTGDTVDFDHGMTVDLEGVMAFFNDSIVRPFSFPKDFEENAEYNTVAASGNVVAFFLKWLIDNHNAQVQDFQKMKLGNVTVTDPDNAITRSSSNYVSTWDAIKSKLFDSALGGYLCIRYEADGNYIDYLSEFTETNSQRVEYGENLLDLTNATEASETYSAIIPIGAAGLTLKGLADGDITGDLVKLGDTIYSRSAVEAYGWIYAPVNLTTWDDVVDDRALRTVGAEWLANGGASVLKAIEATAVDLHFTAEQAESLRIYKNVEVYSAPHGISEIFPLSKLEIDLLNPQNTKVNVGKTLKSLTERTAIQEEEALLKYSKLEKTDEEIRLYVVDEIAGAKAEFKVTLNGLNTTVENYEKTVNGYTTQVANYAAAVDGFSANLKLYSDEVGGYKEQTANYAAALTGYSGEVKNYAETVDGYTEQVISFNGTVEGFTQTVAAYSETVAGYTEQYSIISQTVNNITLEVTDEDGTVSIQLKSGDADLGTAGTIDMTGLVTFSALKTEGETTINGSNITTGTIDAKRLNLYGELKVYEENDGDLGGYIGFCEGFDETEGEGTNDNIGIGVMNSPATGQCICTDDFARLSFGNYSQVIASNRYLDLKGPGIIRFLLPEGMLAEDGETPLEFKSYLRLDDEDFRGYSTRQLRLGNAGNPWSALYADSCSCCTSDENRKNSIEALPEKYLTMFDHLAPKRFKMNTGTSGRYHVGYVAQGVKAAMDIAGIDSTEFGGWIADITEDGVPVYMLRYEEFGAIYAAKIKQLEARMAELEVKQNG